MRIAEISALDGPNIYDSRPVLVMLLELEGHKGRRLSEYPGFMERLLRVVPQGDLNPQSSLAAVIEHVTIEFSKTIRIGVDQCELRHDDRPDPDSVVVPYYSKKGMKALAQLALDFAKALARNEDYPITQGITEVSRVFGQSGLSFNTIAMIHTAEERQIPWMRLSRPNLIQLGYGKNRRIIQSTWTDRTSLIASELATQKHIAKKVLKEASVPVPQGFAVFTLEEAVSAFRKLTPPIVVKPANGKQGIAISLGLTREEELEEAFRIAVEHSEKVLVEEHLQGRDYRVLVIEGKFIAAVQRIPAHVIGDGQHSVAELVEIENRNPVRGEGHTFPMCRIRLGREEKLVLEEKGFCAESVPEAGQMVFLRKGANGSTGGIARDVTDLVHADMRLVCERAARALGLDVCGVDLIATDIEKPLSANSSCGVLEVNPRPGLQPHLFPREGKPQNVARRFLDTLYPENAQFSIPIISILDAEEQGPACRLIGDTLSRATRLKVSISGWDELGRNTSRQLLSDPISEAAVLQVAPLEVLRQGLPYDWADVVLLQGVDAEGIRNPDISRAIHLVLKRVKKGGAVILNVDDPELLALTDSEVLNHPDRNLILISMDSKHPLIRSGKQHQKAYCSGEGSILELTGGREDTILFMEGDARDSMSLMASVAVCRYFGLTPEQLRTAYESAYSQAGSPATQSPLRLQNFNTAVSTQSGSLGEQSVHRSPHNFPAQGS